eukprot:TRINITY_DN5145_c0_g1_i1.p1 TRINITY_DN5145_c0_g1~~TRINITY_DN5145_c0_g1_i1.p1  ORF type:complete len:302 (-),score=67.90 TRINITY_DN5145_c0_g1_i1:266-1099(-)
MSKSIIPTICCSADIWGMGCCLYFLVCGRGAFSASSEWLVFERIQEFDVVIPHNMDATTKSLLKRLLAYDEGKRLGTDDLEMEEFFQHAFFEGLDWSHVSTSQPPTIRASSIALDFPDSDSTASAMSSSSHGGAATPPPASPLSAASSRASEERERIMEAQKSSIWSQYLIPGAETITYQGALIKRASLIPRRRMFLLTDLPRLIYIDPDSMTQKGEVPLSLEVTVELRNAEHFFLHVPGRTYVLQCPKGKAQAWKAAIEDAIVLLQEKERVKSSSR